MNKKILLTLSLAMFVLSIFIVSAPPPGDRSTKCFNHCKKFNTVKEFNACMMGCYNGPLT